MTRASRPIRIGNYNINVQSGTPFIALPLRTQAFDAYQPRDPLRAAVDFLVAQFVGDPSRSVGPTTSLMDRADARVQVFVRFRSPTLGPAPLSAAAAS